MIFISEKELSRAFKPGGFLFSTIFYNLTKMNSIVLTTFDSLSAHIVSLDKSKILLFVKNLTDFTLYYTNPTFNDPEKEGFGKHCRKGRKRW